MANRTTVKSNIITLNVPSVSNADLEDMLNDNICDNVVFGEDVAVSQSSSVSAITCNFTGKDRIDLTRTGGSLAITVSGIGDGETKFLLVTKTAGQAVTFVGVTDVTPVKANADALSLVLYEIVRKNTSYFAKAWVETVQAASDAETQAGSITNKFITPANLESKTATTSRKGIAEMALAAEAQDGSSVALIINPQTLHYVTRAQSYIRSTTGSFTVGTYVGTVVLNADNLTINLPSESTYDGHRIFILNAYNNSNNVVQGTGVGGASGTLNPNTAYLAVSDGSQWWLIELGAITNAGGLACPYVYVNGEYVEEILKNVRNVDGEETINITSSLKPGVNKIRISEEKSEITYLKELYFNGQLVVENLILHEGDEYCFEINYKVGMVGLLTAKGHYVVV